jgi:hypothetical protein
VFVLPKNTASGKLPKTGAFFLGIWIGFHRPRAINCEMPHRKP